jgi:hypothetical protein
MANEDTSGPSVTGTAVDSKAQGDEISADTFKQMVNILKDLRTHTHQYYDDYTTACECQCNCSRGTV